MKLLTKVFDLRYHFPTLDVLLLILLLIEMFLGWSRVISKL